MNMVATRYSRLWVAGLLAAGLFGCRQSVVVPLDPDELPKDVALSFLVTVHSPVSDPECLFQSNGVQVRSGGRLSPEVKPYHSLVVALGPGRFGGGHLSLSNRGDRVWCLFGGSREAKRHDMDNKSFLTKIVTALLAVGVQSRDKAIKLGDTSAAR